MEKHWREEMPKHCTKCGELNSDNAFWCNNCDEKLIEKIDIHKITTTNHSKDDKNNIGIYPIDSKNYNSSSLKTLIALCLFLILCFSAFFVVYQFGIPFISSGSYAGIDCQINDDFWFEGNYLNTSEGWSFELTKVKDYQLDGRILALKTYSKNDAPYDPCNIFSPIDFLIGIDDVKTNPENYDYSITSFYHRTVTWYLYYDDVNDYNYFKAHTGNNHIIPHNKQVLDTLANNISVGDTVIIEGSLVNLHGIRGNQYWQWTTDTQIGNYDCEIILVDSITVTST